jgi:hypothetical protein
MTIDVQHGSMTETIRPLSRTYPADQAHITLSQVSLQG